MDRIENGFGKPPRMTHAPVDPPTMTDDDWDRAEEAAWLDILAEEGPGWDDSTDMSTRGGAR